MGLVKNCEHCKFLDEKEEKGRNDETLYFCILKKRATKKDAIKCCHFVNKDKEEDAKS